MLAVIRDANRRAEWMPACGDSHLVEENLAARTQIAYHRTKAPWPVSDRDSVNRAEMIVEPAKHRVYLPFEAVTAAAGPAGQGRRAHAVHARALDRSFPSTAAGPPRPSIRCSPIPGGILPDWLANLASKTLPRETIAGLRKQVDARRAIPSSRPRSPARPRPRRCSPIRTDGAFVCPACDGQVTNPSCASPYAYLSSPSPA